MTYASFGRRLAAYLIDNLILGAALWLCSVLLVTILGAAAGVGAPARPVGDDEAAAVGFALGMSLLVVMIVLPWLYFAVMESSQTMATLGKRAVGIHVVDGNGRRLSFGRASGRFFAKYLNGLTLCIGWLLPLFTDRRQALHDLVASTVVLKSQA